MPLGRWTSAFVGGSLAALVGWGGPAAAAAGDLVWPSPPAAPRIRHLSVLPSASESVSAPSVEHEESFFRRAVRFALGVSRDAPPPQRPEPLMRLPTGIWAANGFIYAADPGRGKVVRCEIATGKVTAFPERRSRRRAEVVSPVGVAAARDGRVFVSDPGAAAVHVLDGAGRRTGGLPPPGGKWIRPTGLALDEGRDRLYVADTGTHRVHAYRLSGERLFTIGRRGVGKGEFNFPTYLWADAERGRLLVCDSMNFRIQIFDEAGKYAGGFGENGNRPGYLARPRGVSLDSDGNIYVVDGAMETVQVFDEKGRLLLFFGVNGSAPGTFSLPGGVFIAPDDRIYVADTHNGRIQSFKYLKGGPL